MERQQRKILEGEVISNKMEKTVVVKVTHRMRHPLYNKLVERWKKYYAHNENDNIKKGDQVTIMETRPLSKMKRWRVIGVREQS